MKEWSRRGNGVIESAAKTLEDDKSLAVIFLDAAKSSDLKEEMKKKIMMTALIKNVFYAQASVEHDKIKEGKRNREARGSTTSSFGWGVKITHKKEGKQRSKERWCDETKLAITRK
jgi:hypothetical protein